MQQMAPRKTVVGPTGQSPIVTKTGRTDTTPRKTLVGSTARPPIKTVVGSTAAPPRKTLVGSTAAPPRKTTAANLGAGANQGSPAARINPGFAGNHNNAANPRFATRSLGRGDGNMGKSVAPMPPKASGPPNPVMTWDKPQNESSILAGGMGLTTKNMHPPRSRRRSGGSVQSGSAFYGE
jgi:hypothetical protein